jgi:hypothetical protein
VKKSEDAGVGEERKKGVFIGYGQANSGQDIISEQNGTERNGKPGRGEERKILWKSIPLFT